VLSSGGSDCHNVQRFGKVPWGDGKPVGHIVVPLGVCHTLKTAYPYCVVLAVIRSACEQRVHPRELLQEGGAGCLSRKTLSCV